MSSCPKPELRLDWCSHAAAKYAVEHWHYSRNMPKAKNVYMGVWEGGIYQAGGWIYVGLSSRDHAYRDRSGKLWHSRVVGTGVRTQYGKATAEPVRVQDCVRVELPPKHVYLYPLNAEMRSRILPLAKPYPKRPKEQAPEDHSGLGGATPTRPLHSTETPA